MAEPATHSADSGTPKAGAPKDKNCPYCGQAFTSSSLGRHLDLYIKEKNPKPPDGIHDVDAIKKLRGGITRRQPRGSLGGRRDGSTPTGTPKPGPKRESTVQDSDGYRSPAMPADGFAVDSAFRNPTPFQPTWEATGVINDIPRKSNWEGEATQEQNKRPGMQRTVSKQVVQKAQFDVKQKLSDAMDTARAAELALRELVSSWRAAKLQIDNNSMPFDFDPLSLDFPALTLQCLQPPPTLFSSTQHPTSTSWSVQSPGQREFDALRSYFQEEFRTFKITCAAATTSAAEEFTYPPSTGAFRDVREAVRKAEKSAENLEGQVNEHLQSAYTVWESLPASRQQELWILELARSVGRKNKETEKMKEQQHRLKQENANLKSQIDQLNRLQQPREFKMSAPVTVPMERELLTALYEQGIKGGKGVGFTMEDRHVDLGSIVSRSIERWKNVITSTRVSSSGMSAQRPLDQTGQPSSSVTINGPTQTQKTQQQQQPSSQPQVQTPQIQTPQQPVQPQQQQRRPQIVKRVSTTSTSGLTSEATNSTTTTGPPSIEETSDQDADAEMEDDDSFAIMNTSPVKPQPPMQQQATLEVPRTRGPVQQRNPDPRFMMPNGTGSPVGRAAINMSRSMPNMNMAMQNASMHGGDMGMAMQGVRGDPMFLE
ncbi:Fc.00g042800.m01.CDS01 [Cosmosporella sp. VM-42]